MKKLMALFKTPPDVDAFMKHYRDIHLPLVEKLPGLIKIEVTRIEQTKVGQQGYFMITQMYFADEEALKTAMASPENAAVFADGMALAGDLVTVMVGETLDI